MKFIFAILLVSTPALGGMYMSESDIAAARAGGQGVKTYSKLAKCEQAEAPDSCHYTVGSDISYYTVQSVREGAFEAPTAMTDCVDVADCDTQVADVVAKCGDASYRALHGDFDSDGDLESWCTRQSLVTRLREDATLKAAHDATVAAKAAEESNRQAKGVTRAASIDSCALAVSLSGPEQAACIQAIAKELARTRLAESDL